MDIEIELLTYQEPETGRAYWQAAACGEWAESRCKESALDELMTFITPDIAKAILAGETVRVSIKAAPPMPSAHPPADTDPQTPTSRSSQGMKAVKGFILGVDE
jgi:hypothetical protein